MAQNYGYGWEWVENDAPRHLQTPPNPEIIMLNPQQQFDG
jgi:hypothetical protein